MPEESTACVAITAYTRWILNVKSHAHKPKENALKGFTRKTRLEAIRAKLRGPSPAEKLAAFVRTQMSCGASMESAFKQAERMNVAGCNND